MPEVGIPYVLTGPDGTRAVLGDNTDPDFVGYLDPENGITGLLDSAPVRESVDDKTEGHGGIQGNNYLGHKVGTLQGIIFPGADMSVVNARISKLSRATRALLAAKPSIMTWTPTGGVQRQLTLYRQGEIRITGRRPKAFMVPLSSPDPYIYSAALHSQSLILTGSTGDAGFSSPISSPFGTVYNATAQGFVSNIGDAETWPLIVFQGPFTNPGVFSNTTGQQWVLTYTLTSSDTLTIDTKSRTVILNNGINRYSAYAANFSVNQWWSLQAGANDVRLLSGSYTPGVSAATIYWRDAWEI